MAVLSVVSMTYLRGGTGAYPAADITDGHVRDRDMDRFLM